MATALLWYAGVCAVLGTVLVLIIVVQRVAPVLARTRSAVGDLPPARLERPLRHVA